MNRREFLYASVGAACALAAIPAAAESDRPLHVALIGCGPRGQVLADTALRSGCQISAAWDTDLASALAVAARYRASAYRSLRELLTATSPEIAIVTERLDGAGASALVQAGAHLLLDAVPAAPFAEILTLRNTMAACGKVVQVNAAGPGLVGCPEAVALLRSEQMGRINTVRAHLHHYHPSAPRIDRWAVLGWVAEILTQSGEGSLRRVTATGHAHHRVVTWEFDTLTAIWEQRVFLGTAEERVSHGATWYGSGAALRVNGDAWRFQPHGTAREECGSISGQHRDAECWEEFLRTVRAQRQPGRSLDVALCAAEMVRLAECSLKLERPLEWDARRRQVVRDAEANRLLRSAPEWLA